MTEAQLTNSGNVT